MTETGSVSLADCAALATAFAAFVALGFNAYANTLIAKAQSLQNVYDFLSRLEKCTDTLIAANAQKDKAAFKRARSRATNFLEATCHGLNNKLFAGDSRNMARANTINLIAAMEIVATDAFDNISTSDSYSEIAKFAKLNRTAIDKSKSEQLKSGVMV